MTTQEGDVVLDPFCGCGTTIAAAQHLGRHWIGIDITPLAITLIRNRLHDQYGRDIAKTYEIIGEPTTYPDACVLAEQDKHHFQLWALGQVNARPAEIKRGADQGIDGRLYFLDDTSGVAKQVILSVKGGQNISVADVRDLGHVVTRENAQIGVLITLEEPKQTMRAEAASGGVYLSPWRPNQPFPRLQVLSVAELLSGKTIEMPPDTIGRNTTFKRAPKATRAPTAVQGSLLDGTADSSS